MFRKLPAILAILLLPHVAMAQQNTTPQAGSADIKDPAAPATTPENPAPEEPKPEAAPAASDDIIPLPGGETPPADSGAPVDQTPDIALPEPSTDAAMPDDAFTDPNAIIPGDIPQPPPSLVTSSKEESARITDIKYREVRVKVDNEPEVVAMREKSETAKTDEDKRAALRTYYRMLFKRMVAIDKSLELKCKIMESAYLRRLAQTRIEPTIPLNLPPTPEPVGQ